MGTFIADLFDPELLAKRVNERHVHAQRHPELPLTIYNYTERCVFDNAWDTVTLTCRGLIVSDDGQVTARPFPKFFNYGQEGAPNLDLSARTIVTDKADGSLGILYPDGDGWSIATRGSFTSDQAIHATQLWKGRYEGRVMVGEGLTWLFEIVYPDNRIVLDYGGMDDLILLGGIGIADGATRPVSQMSMGWPGPAVTTFDHPTLADALAAPPRDNAEGLVVHAVDTDHDPVTTDDLNSDDAPATAADDTTAGSTRSRHSSRCCASMTRPSSSSAASP